MAKVPQRNLRYSYHIHKNPFNKAFKASAKALGLGAMAVGAGFGLYALSGQARKDQNVKIEMQKISKEKWAGKQFTRKEISSRLKKAKQSKRKFTWV